MWPTGGDMKTGRRSTHLEYTSRYIDLYKPWWMDGSSGPKVSPPSSCLSRARTQDIRNRTRRLVDPANIRHQTSPPYFWSGRCPRRDRPPPPLHTHTSPHLRPLIFLNDRLSEPTARCPHSTTEHDEQIPRSRDRFDGATSRAAPPSSLSSVRT